MEQLTKAQLVSMLAEKLDCPKRTAQTMLETLTEIVHAQLKAGNTVVLQDLAKFTTKDVAATAARQGRNPATGAAITIAARPAHKKVSVKAASGLKKILG